MIFDKNKKRLNELYAKGTDGHAARLATLQAAGPEWWIQYYDPSRRLRAERCPDKYQTESGARKYYMLKVSEMERGAYNLKDVARVTMAQIVDAYLDEKMMGRGGERSARTLGKHVKSMIGVWRLESIDRNPALIVKHLKAGLPATWSQKYRWNYFLLVRAAINHWIRFRRLTMHNPCQLVEMDPGTRVMDYVPTRADLDRIITQSIVVGLPDWIRNLFTVSFYTGRRIGEIMRLRVEDVVLAPADGLPYVWFVALKQRRQMRKPKPITREAAAALAAQIGPRTAGDVWPCKTPPYKLLRDSGLREAAGWAHRWFHDNRKAAAMVFRQMGGREVAKGMLDHQTDRMSEWYTHWQREGLESAVAASYHDQCHDQTEAGPAPTGPATN
jgi:integrase